MKRVVLASNNAGKVREIHDLLMPLDLEVIPQGALGISEADEPHHTFVENALAKARHAARASGLPALADDSGICVAALGGEPGVHSAYYAGHPRSDDANNRRLVAALGRTAAELDQAEKNAVSHRGKALRRLALWREEG